MVKSLIFLYKRCRRSDTSFVTLLLKAIFYKIFFNKKILAHQHVKIKGTKNIISNNILEIGINNSDFNHKKDWSILNVKGKLSIADIYSIVRGCRIVIGTKWSIKIGYNGYINSNTQLIIMHNLTIGDNVAIAWNCQILDEDFHNLSYPDKKINENNIIIGNNVWIGCNVFIYKGSIIPDGCIIASNSVIKGTFNKKNTLIGGNPAKVIKENVSWY